VVFELIVLWFSGIDLKFVKMGRTSIDQLMTSIKNIERTWIILKKSELARKKIKVSKFAKIH
jgi:hypothetical protein